MQSKTNKKNKTKNKKTQHFSRVIRKSCAKRKPHPELAHSQPSHLLSFQTASIFALCCSKSSPASVNSPIVFCLSCCCRGRRAQGVFGNTATNKQEATLLLVAFTNEQLTRRSKPKMTICKSLNSEVFNLKY